MICDVGVVRVKPSYMAAHLIMHKGVLLLLLGWLFWGEGGIPKLTWWGEGICQFML